MTKVKPLTLVLAALLPLAAGANETAPETAPTPSAARTWNWMQFDASQVSIFQNANHNTFSGALTWAPSWRFAENWAARLDVGAALLKGSSKLFIAPRGQVFIQRRLGETLTAELGAGMQDWSSASASSSSTSSAGVGFFLTGSTNLRYRYSELFEPFIGYSTITGTSFASFSHEARVGLGVTF